MVRRSTTRVRSSVLRHLDVDAIEQQVRSEVRARQHALPPIATYRWWARRTEAVSGALIDAANVDIPGRLTIADPFCGGGVIALAALLREHQVYAQDINPWAVQGLATMLTLPAADDLEAAAGRLHDRVYDTLTDAYATRLSDGTPGMIVHTLRVAAIDCPSCGQEVRLFPAGLVTLTTRVDVGGSQGWLACPAGHLQLGDATRRTRCATCRRLIDPTSRPTADRCFRCVDCGSTRKIDRAGPIRWLPILVERASALDREIDQPRAGELTRANDSHWPVQPRLAKIRSAEETKYLLRYGMSRWDDLYPRRQQVVLRALLQASRSASRGDDTVHAALRAAIVSAAEMAGYLARWDGRYLKAYEATANHRYNFTTLAAEPNVWGAYGWGRGTVSRRLEQLEKASIWSEERFDRRLNVTGPVSFEGRRRPIGRDVDAQVVVGSSTRLLAPDESLDLICTDPPYHDDVHYGELSEPFRAWARMGTGELDEEAVVTLISEQTDVYERLLTEIFSEMNAALKPDGHVVLSYANREAPAWLALCAALDAAGFEAVGYEVIESENVFDHVKTGRRACTLDVILDLVKAGTGPLRRFRPRWAPKTDEEDFCQMVGEYALGIGSFADGWRISMNQAVRSHPFVRPTWRAVTRR